MQQARGAPFADPAGHRHWLRRSVRSLWVMGLGALLVPALAEAQLTEAQLSDRVDQAGAVRRFKGSQAQLSTFLGSGTFVANEFSNNPYFSQSLSVLPRFRLARAQSLRLFWSLEWEYTEPNNSAGRRLYPSDLRLSYHHVDLVRDPWLKGRLMTSGQVWLPLSLESRHNHTVVNVRGTLAYLVVLARGRLQLQYSFGVQKYFPTDKVRGFSGDQGDGAGLPVCLSRGAAGFDGACGSGGPMNDNWQLRNFFGAAWFFTPKLWLSASFMIMNYFRFAVPDDALADPELPMAGQADFTFGGIELSYQLIDHVILGFGTSSHQPALTPTGGLRFPFWDFSSPSNNYSRFYFAVTTVY